MPTPGRTAAQLPGRQRFRPAWTLPCCTVPLSRTCAFAAAALKMAKLRLLIEPILRHSGLLPEPHGSGDCHPRRGGRRQRLRAVRHLPRPARGGETWPPRCKEPGASPMCSWPTTPAATGRQRRINYPFCSRTSIASILRRLGGLRYKPAQGYRRPAWGGWKNWQEKGSNARLISASGLYIFDYSKRQGGKPHDLIPSSSVSSAWASWARRVWPPDRRKPPAVHTPAASCPRRWPSSATQCHHGAACAEPPTSSF